jgi:hypothetical protein
MLQGLHAHGYRHPESRQTLVGPVFRAASIVFITLWILLLLCIFPGFLKG